MRIALDDEQKRLKCRAAEYFNGLMTPEVLRSIQPSEEGHHGSRYAYRGLIKQIGADGWLRIGWSTEYGGGGESPLEQKIVYDEATTAGIPLPFLTITAVGPTIAQFGTPEQKAELLPAMLGGDTHVAIGYSEASAGTDLGNLTTSARRLGDGYVLTGQKMWTSLIHYADYVWVAARTDPVAPTHRGLSIFLVPTDAPGFSWAPVRTVSSVTSVTYYDDVQLPLNRLIGEENGGWQLIVSQLNHERVGIGSSALVTALWREVYTYACATKLADGTRLIDQEWVRVHLGTAAAKIDALKLMNWKICSSTVDAASASTTKVFGSELPIEVYRLMMEVLGDRSVIAGDSPGSVLHGRLQQASQNALVNTFGGGTNEVQRDIIARVGLGLPKVSR